MAAAIRFGIEDGEMLLGEAASRTSASHRAFRSSFHQALQMCKFIDQEISVTVHLPLALMHTYNWPL